jgi:signal transduction histidine kinase/ligand-binding sensor domain-containing protein/AraC-like DNA-binding protein/ActR/RegA family two-component response regulator
MMKALILLYTLCCGFVVYANSNIQMYVSPLYINRGMNPSTIYDIYQDEFGIVWFATQHGLVRYDGTRMQNMGKLYECIPDAEEVIRSVTGNYRGNLYLETRAGIIEYSLEKETFRKIIPNSNCFYYTDSCLWVGYQNHVYQWRAGEYVKYCSLPEKRASIDCIIQTSQGNTWVGTRNHGVFMISRDKSISRFLTNVTQVQQLLQDNGRRIWIGTRRNGLYRIDPNGSVHEFKHSEAEQHSLSSNIIRSLCEDDVGNIWIATFNGLMRYDQLEEHFTGYEFIDENTYSLNDASIYCLMKDRQGYIWSGTFHGKINCFHPQQNSLSYFFVPEREPLTPNRPAVFGQMVEDNSGNLYLAAERDGLYFFNKLTRKLTRLDIEENVQSLYYDKQQDQIWIGTLLHGLKMRDLKTHQTHSFTREILHNNSIREIVPYNDSLLLATHNRISLFDPQTGINSVLKPFNRLDDPLPITTFMLDSQKQLWMASRDHLYCYNLQTKKWKEIEIHPSENINVNKLIESRQGDIFVGTSRHGIYRKPQADTLFTPFLECTQQTINVIDMREDRTGGLLIAANNGLLYVTPQGRRITIDRSRFLSTFRFGRNCLFIDRHNTIYLGGINMVGCFPLNLIRENRLSYEVGISELTVGGNPIPGIGYITKIKLGYDQHTLNIKAYTNNYASLFTCGIEYKLEPFDKTYRHANSLNEISYTNLSPNHYVLYLKGDMINSDGSYPERQLAIIITPPFYRTTIAYCLYVLLLALLLYEAYQVIMLRSSLKVEQQQKRNAEQLNQSKLRFFTNISHEFKTPLTLVSNQVELLMHNHKFSPRLNARLLSIWRNVTRLNLLITELMEFRKQEQGFTTPKVSLYNLSALVCDVTDSFKEYAQTRQINLNCFPQVSNVTFYFDKQLIEKVLFNLLSNAFKFTPAGGCIRVQLTATATEAIVDISDTGVGIDAKELTNIFDRFYQTDTICFTNNIGTGIGLAYAKSIVEAHQGHITVKSIKGKGSCFTVHLPTQIHYQDKQIEACLPDSKEADDVLITTYPTEQSQDLSAETLQSPADEAQEGDTVLPKLLIVEDNRELLHLLVEVFASQYRIDSAENGRIGYEKAMEAACDIIICDVVMPEMSGVELCRKVKNNLKTSHIPIILLTSQAAFEYITEGLKSGADDYISKPFSIRHLMIRCNNLINLRRTLQQKYAHDIHPDTSGLALSPLDRKLLNDSIQLIHENMDNPLFSIDFLSQSVGMGRTKYFAKMKAITGMTPNEFILNAKLKMACHSIEQEPALSITELSERLGFNNTSYFIRCFKHFTGMTPHRYKQQKK